MTAYPFRSFFGVLAFFTGLFLLFAPNIWGQFERQSIEGGGMITGRLVNPDASAGEDYRIELSGGGEITLHQKEIAKKELLSPEAIQYRLTAPLTPDTVEAHREMAEWAQENGLSAEARLHRERILELDPENEETRRALGYEKRDGVWMTPKERREQAGLEMYGGRAVTPQEAELLRQKDAYRKAASQWKKYLRNIANGLHQRENAAKDELWQIKAPEALEAVTDALRKEENPQIRILYVKAMGNIATPAALGDLASIALGDDDAEVRLTALEIIEKNPKSIPGAVTFFRDSLHRPENQYVNRAGFALAFLDAEMAIDDLINALVTTHRETIVTPGSQTTASFSNKGFSFNPGSSEKTKVVTSQMENADVLDALRRIVAKHYPFPADFGFDVPAWKDWLADQRNLQQFNSRRDL